MKVKSQLAISLLSISLLLITGCSSNKSSSQQKSITIMEPTDLLSLDISESGGTTWYALSNSMEGLYKADKNNQPVPASATKVVEPTNAGKTYTIPLRHQAKWSNGDHVTAEDFVAAWKRSVNPTAKSGYSYIFSGIKNADAILAGQKQPQELGVKALDKYTLEIQLDHPMPYFNKMLVMPAFFPENRTALKKFGSQYGTKSNYVYYNGPFKVTNWDGTNNSWTLKKNKLYYAHSQIKLNTIKYLVVKDSNTAHELFEQNKLDEAIVNGIVAKNLQKDKNLIHEHKGGTYILRANLRNNRPLANQKMRQAISLSINRKSLTKDILADGSVPAYTYTAKNVAIDPTTKKDFGSEIQPKQTYNLQLAKKLWQQGRQEAGLTGKVNIELIGDDQVITKNSAEFIQAALEKNLPQLKVTIKNIPDKSVTTAVRAGKFDAHQTLWLADFADPISFMGTATSSSPKNTGHYQDATFDQLYKNANNNATNQQEYWANLRSMEQRLIETTPNIPLYQMVESHLVNPKLKGVLRHPVGFDDYTHAYLKE